MVTFLITSFFILAILALAIYYWQKPASTTETDVLLPQPPGRGLFIDGAFDSESAPEIDLEALARGKRERTELLARAQDGDTSALSDTHARADRELYEEALNLLISRADSPAQLLSLVSLITRHELPVNKNLAERFIDSCKVQPDRISITKMLHIAALSDEAATYQRAVETALECRRKGLVPDISAEELRSILDGEFWILSSGTRSSGAGFILKRTLATARRELQPAQNER